ncbi:hypothetical protein LJC33_07330, partial [Eubacteriales bacterium OttesenSCG-928-N13]|nr:hypothetical protein [Eubacteriales bacterium OttesenSCG-928-N13]
MMDEVVVEDGKCTKVPLRTKACQNAPVNIPFAPTELLLHHYLSICTKAYSFVDCIKISRFSHS